MDDPFLDEHHVDAEPCGLGWLPLAALWIGCALVGAGLVLAIDHATRRPR